jgi:cathepsin L
MQLALILLGFICLSTATQWRELCSTRKHTYTFAHFKAEFGRAYATGAEHALRKGIFERRLASIIAHNNGNSTWKRGINRFADRTDAEYKAVLGLKGSRSQSRYKSDHWIQAPADLWDNVDVSGFAGANVDWRTKGVITPPKDQGGCGSCWTFATAETIESYNALKNNKLVTLSEQQILDCTPNPNNCGGTGGCGGGTVELAVARIVEMGGLSTEDSYPYVSGGGQNFQCDSSKLNYAVNVSKYIDLPSNMLPPVLTHVATTGPLAISVDASSWSDYESGVFDGCNNVNPDLDHAVQLVGFGTDPSLGDYWLVRNSWGSGYGEDGYIRLKRYARPPCGIDNTPGDGDGCSGGPPSVKVCGNCGILYDTTYVVISSK